MHGGCGCSKCTEEVSGSEVVLIAWVLGEKILSVVIKVFLVVREGGSSRGRHDCWGRRRSCVDTCSGWGSPFSGTSHRRSEYLGLCL